MDASELRAWCLQHGGAIEDFPFGLETSVFKVAGKMFALSALGRAPLSVSVKCEPELAVGLRRTYPAIRPGYHLNKRHWNTIALDGSLPDQLVRDLVEDSYDLVVSALPKRVREELGGQGRGISLDPTQTDPDKYAVIFENERVRVLDYKDGPGDRTSPHRHPDSVMYTLSSFERRLIHGDRETDTHSIFVELKEPSPAAAPDGTPELGPSTDR